MCMGDSDIVYCFLKLKFRFVRFIVFRYGYGVDGVVVDGGLVEF